MELHLALQEQGYSPEKSLLVVSIHAPIRATAEQQQQQQQQQQQRAVGEESRGCSNNTHQENNEMVIGIANK